MKRVFNIAFGTLFLFILAPYLAYATGTTEGCVGELREIGSADPTDILLNQFTKDKRPPFDLKKVTIEYAKGEGYVFSVLKVDGKAIGYSRLWPKGDENYSHQFITLTSKDYQGKGIGQLFYTGIGYVVTQDVKRNFVPDLTNGKSKQVWKSLEAKGFAKGSKITASEYLENGSPNTLNQFWSARVKEVPFENISKEYQDYEIRLNAHHDLW